MFIYIGNIQDYLLVILSNIGQFSKVLIIVFSMHIHYFDTKTKNMCVLII